MYQKSRTHTGTKSHPALQDNEKLNNTISQ